MVNSCVFALLSISSQNKNEHLYPAKVTSPVNCIIREECHGVDGNTTDEHLSLGVEETYLNLTIDVTSPQAHAFIYSIFDSSLSHPTMNITTSPHIIIPYRDGIPLLMLAAVNNTHCHRRLSTPHRCDALCDLIYKQLKAILNITKTEESNGRIVLSWNDPGKYKAFIQNFVVVIHPVQNDNSNGFRKAKSSVNHTSSTFSELSAGTFHVGVNQTSCIFRERSSGSFHIAMSWVPRTTNGASNQCPRILKSFRITAPEETEPGPCELLSGVTAIDIPMKKAINVSWQDDKWAQSDMVKYFYVKWGEQDEASGPIKSVNKETVQEKQVSASETYLLLENLTANTYYMIQVFAILSEGYVMNKEWKPLLYTKTYKLEEAPVVVPVIAVITTPSYQKFSEPDNQIIPRFLFFVVMSFGLIMLICLGCVTFMFFSKSRSKRTKVRRSLQTVSPNVYHDNPSRNNSRKSSIASDLFSPSDFHKPMMEVDHWEIAQHRLKLSEPLGKGAFGQVVKGYLEGRICLRQSTGTGWAWVPVDTGKRETTVVAVKLLKDYAPDSQKQEFLQEITMMKNLGYHPNVVCLMGCCTISEPLFVIVEACPLGDLQQYLLKHRKQILGQSDEPVSLDDSDILNPIDLLSFARQITMGMEYLSQKGYVHRDLAARNVLVSSNKCLKIADFGLTRYIYEDRLYMGKKGARMPVKWMSIEAIMDGIYTIKSDVWSFGVVLYEIVTLGGTPYPGLANKDLPKFLCGGCRMERPDQCPEELHVIMCLCWIENPSDRPSFTDLRLKLEALLELNTPYLSLYSSQAHVFHSLDDIREESHEEDTISHPDDSCGHHDDSCGHPDESSCHPNESLSEVEPMLDKELGSETEDVVKVIIETEDLDKSNDDEGRGSLESHSDSSEYVNTVEGVTSTSLPYDLSCDTTGSSQEEVALVHLSSPDSYDSGMVEDSKFFNDLGREDLGDDMSDEIMV